MIQIATDTVIEEARADRDHDCVKDIDSMFAIIVVPSQLKSHDVSAIDDENAAHLHEISSAAHGNTLGDPVCAK